MKKDCFNVQYGEEIWEVRYIQNLHEIMKTICCLQLFWNGSRKLVTEWGQWTEKWSIRWELHSFEIHAEQIRDLPDASHWNPLL